MNLDSIHNSLILVVEDDPDIQEILREYLERAGFRTVGVSDGNLAYVQSNVLKPDLILLDIKLPGMDGKELLTKIREKTNIPIIMVTAIIDDVDKLLTLKNGADDYIIKPFNPNEVVERVRAVLRRTRGVIHASEVLRIGNLEVDTEKHLVSVLSDGGNVPEILPLTPTEYCLLENMSKSPFKAFSRAELVEDCMPESDAYDRVIDSHLSNLRRKLKQMGGRDYIESVRGVGYRLCQIK